MLISLEFHGVPSGLYDGGQQIWFHMIPLWVGRHTILVINLLLKDAESSRISTSLACNNLCWWVVPGTRKIRRGSTGSKNKEGEAPAAKTRNKKRTRKRSTWRAFVPLGPSMCNIRGGQLAGKGWWSPWCLRTAHVPRLGHNSIGDSTASQCHPSLLDPQCPESNSGWRLLAILKMRGEVNDGKCATIKSKLSRSCLNYNSWLWSENKSVSGSFEHAALNIYNM